ncbi:hypothetical protein JYU06_00270 [Desulfotalea psychrophila]|uniref:Uncharacterized protein n=1 Tax=Desulfotalea psychrophila TaxID=84980 RepID=A0ABS3ATL6_9BACT|nr:hypothetical protein [Desulfotalea psychrophila]
MLIIPQYLDKKPIIQEYLTVDLVNISAPLPAPVVKTASQTQKSPVKPIVSKPDPKKTVSIAPVIPEKITPPRCSSS